MSDPVIGSMKTEKLFFSMIKPCPAQSKPHPDHREICSHVALQRPLRSLIRFNGEEKEPRERLVKITMSGKRIISPGKISPSNLKPTGEKNPQHIGQVILLKKCDSLQRA